MTSNDTNREGNEMKINAMNAYKFNDNYRIEKQSTGECVGLEHNQEEADAVARYLTNYHGQNHIVVRNAKDDVRTAQELRRDVLRVKNRDLILSDMGVGK